MSESILNSLPTSMCSDSSLLSGSSLISSTVGICSAAGSPRTGLAGFSGNVAGCSDVDGSFSADAVASTSGTGDLGNFTSTASGCSIDGFRSGVLRSAALRSAVLRVFDNSFLRRPSELELSLPEFELELLDDELLELQLQFEPHEQLESESLELDDWND